MRAMNESDGEDAPSEGSQDSNASEEGAKIIDFEARRKAIHTKSPSGFPSGADPALTRGSYSVDPEHARLFDQLWEESGSSLSEEQRAEIQRNVEADRAWSSKPLPDEVYYDDEALLADAAEFVKSWIEDKD